MKTQKLNFIFILLFSISFLFAEEPVLTVQASVSWEKGIFSSATSMNVKAAGLKMPAARGAGIQRINMELPLLVKDAICTLPLDSANTIGDAVTSGQISLDDISKIINDGKFGAAYFEDNMKTLSVPHNAALAEIGSLFIHHTKAYTPEIPLDYQPSRAYTGIIIDTRGTFPVHGESVSEKLHPCLFPKIWDTDMKLIYERNTINPELAIKQGIVQYAPFSKVNDYKARVGRDPLRITARAIFGQNRTDILISKQDGLRIFNDPQNLTLLKQGKILIICDDDMLIDKNLTPKKDGQYYYAFSNIQRIIQNDKPEEIEVENSPSGIKLLVYNIHFQADTAEILNTEDSRLDLIAESLNEALASAGNSTFLIDGHTASVGKPQEEMNLSYERANKIIDEMVKRGIDRAKFSFRGFGGTKPVGDNSSSDGRAKNRRVEITIKLKNW